MNLKILNSDDFIFFTTHEYASIAKTSLSSASSQLARLESKGIIRKLTRGIWANVNHPYFSPIAATNYLLGSEQGYVSFLTALHRHGIISQIPPEIQIATTGSSRKLASPIANYEFIKLNPRMMMEGIQWSDTKVNYRIASPEKALLDTLYISTRKGNRFSSLPELNLDNFDKKYFFNLLDKQVSYKRIKNAILKIF